MRTKHCRRIVLVDRPDAEPRETDFRLEEIPVPEPGPGEVLVRVIYLSLDPYMRGRMRESASYAPYVRLGKVMVGGTVGEIVVSKAEELKVGDIVVGSLGWQEYAVASPRALRMVDPSLTPISYANGILGMPGLTAYHGLFEIGQPKPGETVVISAASGAVGQVAGQLAKVVGCHVVGVAGGPRKCGYVVDELGFDACLDYKHEPDLTAAILSACPTGVDVYFDNVGGVVSDAVLRNLNFWSRIVLCGSVSQYNSSEPGPRLMGSFVGKRVTARGFIVWDFDHKSGPALQHLAELVKSNRLKYREDFVDGLENAPRALIGLLRGENFGKLQIRVGPDPAV